MPDESTIHGNFDKCPKCRKDVDNLHQFYDQCESLIGRTCLEEINEYECPHCGAHLALVTELTHSLATWADTV